MVAMRATIGIRLLPMPNSVLWSCSALPRTTGDSRAVLRNRTTTLPFGSDQCYDTRLADATSR